MKRFRLTSVILICLIAVCMAAVPAHAADVETHDMLDTDSASITKLTVDDIVSGTAPFDKDDQPGDDSSADNATIRSFDTATYDISYTVTPDSTMTYYRKARVGFTFTLPVSADVAGFDTDSMLWVDRTPGFTPTVTTSGGVQTLTCYRLLTPTEGAPTVAPGTSGVSLAVKVKAAHNGQVIQPQVTAWPAWNASDPTDMGTHRAAHATPGPLTVSARVSLNVRVQRSADVQNSEEMTWDFSKAPNAPNSGLGKVKGVITAFSYAVDMRWPDRTKGLRGLEIPQGDLSFDVTTTATYADESNAKHPHAAKEALQPYAWATGGIRITTVGPDQAGRDTRSQYTFRDDNYNFASRSTESDNARWRNSTYGNGTTTLTQVSRTAQGTVMHITIHGWKADPDRFPKYASADNQSRSDCSHVFGDAGCKTMEVGEVSVGTLFVLSPTTVDGTGVAAHYGSPQSLTVHAAASALSIAGTPARDAVSDDNTLQASRALLLPGRYLQVNKYSCPTNQASNNGYQYGSNCKAWNAGENYAGSDALPIGHDMASVGGYYYSGSYPALPVLGLSMITWNPDHIDMSHARVQTATSVTQVWRHQGDKPTVRYGVKPDGSNWASDTEQAKATIKSLNWYDTYAEAAKHGRPVAGLLSNREIAAGITAGANRNARILSGGLVGRIRSDATPGTVTQMTGYTAVWSRRTLHDKAGAPDPDAPDSQWRAWAADKDAYTLMQTIAPTFTMGSGNYVKASYKADGTLVDPSASEFYGDSLLITGEDLAVSKTVAQADEAGRAKSVFDLDKEQRVVDWRVTATATAPSSHTTTITVFDTVPKGLTYMAGSSCVDGTYTDTGAATGGTTSGCKAIEPTATANKDGSVTLVWQVPADSDGKPHTVDYKTTIGNASDPDGDAKNNQQYVNYASVRSTYNQASRFKDMGRQAQAGMRVSRTHSSNLATRAMPLLMELGDTVGFRDMLGNYSKDAKPDVTAVDILPYDGYHGTLTLSGLKVSAANGADLKTVRIWATDDVSVRTADPLTIGRTQVTGWRELKLDRSAGMAAIPDGFRATAFALTSDLLPGGARYDLDLSLTPSGGRPGDVFTNLWTDGDNKVTAVSQTVARAVSGVVWTDRDGDGSRGTGSSDTPLEGVHVTLLDKDGATVHSVTGAPLTGLTGKDGSYRLDGVPAGTGYRLRVSAADGTDWTGVDLTVREAKGVSDELNSKASPVRALGVLQAGGIALKPFPAASAMASARYEDTWENAGLTGRPAAALPLTGGRDMLGALPAALTAMTGVLLAGAWLLSHRRTRGAHAA